MLYVNIPLPATLGGLISFCQFSSSDVCEIAYYDIGIYDEEWRLKIRDSQR